MKPDNYNLPPVWGKAICEPSNPYSIFREWELEELHSQCDDIGDKCCPVCQREYRGRELTPPLIPYDYFPSQTYKVVCGGCKYTTEWQRDESCPTWYTQGEPKAPVPWWLTLLRGFIVPTVIIALIILSIIYPSTLIIIVSAIVVAVCVGIIFDFDVH